MILSIKLPGGLLVHTLRLPRGTANHIGRVAAERIRQYACRFGVSPMALDWSVYEAR